MLKQAERSTYVRASRELVYAVLTDFESYSLWWPDVTASRVLAAEGEVTIAELIAPPFGDGKLVLEFVASPQEWLTFNQVDRLREDGLSGRWDVTRADDREHAVVEGRLSWAGGWLDAGRRRQVPRVLNRAADALTSWCQRLGPQATGDLAGRRKILEIERRGGLISVEVGGERFDLGPTAGGGT